METKRPFPKLALGAVHMLNWAISDHVRRFYGQKPRRIELHPAIAPEIKGTLFRKFAYLQPFNGNLVYRDVPILFHRLAERPLLVNCNGDIEYL